MSNFMGAPYWQMQPIDGLELDVREELGSIYERAFHEYTHVTLPSGVYRVVGATKYSRLSRSICVFLLLVPPVYEQTTN